MDNRQIGRLIAGPGLFPGLAGLLIWAGGFAWFGRLPGDIRLEGERSRVYVPLATMLVISVVLSSGLDTLLRILRRLL